MNSANPQSCLIGLRGDVQTEALAPYFDQVFFFDDYDETWTFSIESDQVTLWREKNPITITELDSLYLRGPNMDSSMPLAVQQAFCLLTFFLNEQMGLDTSRRAISNKVSQLVKIGAYSPKTEIFHNRKIELTGKDRFICKSISNEKSKPMCGLASDFSKKWMVLPTLIQKALDGRELKINAILVNGKFRYLAVEVEKDETGNVRENPAIRPFELRPTDSFFKKIEDLANRIHSSSGLSYFDFDVFIDSRGNVGFLEWNNAICPAPFEFQIYGLPILSLSHLLRPQPVVIGQKSDRVVQTLHSSSDSKDFIYLWLNELQSSKGDWQIIDINGLNLLKIKSRYRRIKSVTVRIVNQGSDSAATSNLENLYRMLEWIDCRVSGKISHQFRNGSKPLQMASTLRLAMGQDRESSTNLAVKIPNALIIKKTLRSLTEVSAILGPDVIVKSLSGQRSIVVDQSEFQNWQVASMAALPTFFQEKIIGTDARIHSVARETFAVQVPYKESVDYRYSARSTFLPLTVPEDISTYCAALGRIENNPMIGVDFLIAGSTFYCLESNPSPGWSWYYGSDSPMASAVARWMSHA